jgi:DNA-binding CsgD family transcriptional regulator
MELAAQEFLSSTSQEWRAEASHAITSAGARWPLEFGLWIQALILDAQGDAPAAVAMLAGGWAAAEPLRYFLGYRLLGCDLVRLAMRAGEMHLAASVTAAVEAGAERSGVQGAQAAAQQCRGMLEDDADRLRAAVEAYRATDRVMERAVACEDAGLAARRAGRHDESVALLEEALEILHSAGATRAAARVESALRSLGVRHRRASAASAAQTGWDSLTPTEMRVARLAAQGLTNRQIGDQLFVSRRTVETHLAHAFAKLGLSSRAQLAAEVALRSAGASGARGGAGPA